MSYLYWRIKFTNLQSAPYIEISELELRESVGGADQCSGGIATASSQYSATYSADKAFDDSITTAWIGTDGEGSWIQYQFSSSKDIKEISFIARTTGYEGYFSDDIELSASNNGSDWDSIATWTDCALNTYPNAMLLAVSGIEYTALEDTSLDIVVLGEASLYWRLVFTDLQSAPYIEISELELRESAGGADQCSGGIATASSQLSSSFSADKAFDNSTTTSWIGTDGEGSWIQYQFSSSKNIKEISFIARTTGYEQYFSDTVTLLASHDGDDWVQVYEWVNCALNTFPTPMLLATSSVEYIALESASLDVQVGATELIDFKLDIAWYYQNISNSPLDIYTIGSEIDDSKLDISVGLQEIEVLPLNVNVATEQIKNFILDLCITAGILTNNMSMDIHVSDGNTIQTIGLDCMAVSTMPEFKSIYAMHLNSAIKEITS